MTQWDICINLNEILTTEQEGESPDSVVVSVSRKAKVLMNVGYARQFANVLLRHIEQHENVAKQQALESTKEQPPAPTETKSD